MTTKIPCQNCGDRCDYEVPVSHQDRVFYCESCGSHTVEGISRVGGPSYTPHEDPPDGPDPRPEDNILDYEGGDSEQTTEDRRPYHERRGQQRLDRWADDN